MTIDRSGKVGKAQAARIAFFALWALVFLGMGEGRAGGPAKELSLAEFSEILEKYRGLSRMEVRFSQTKTVKDLGLSLNSQGRLTVLWPDTVIWQVEKPSPMKAVLNTREITVQEGDRGEVEKYPIGRVSGQMAENMKQMIVWLKFDADTLYRDFRVSPDGRNGYSFSAREKSATGFNSLHMELGPDKHIRKMTLIEPSGDTVDINFDEPRLQKKP